MPYFNKFYGIEVREEIAAEWTDSSGKVDDIMAGLHEMRARYQEEMEGLSPEEQTELCDKRAEEIIKKYGLKLKLVKKAGKWG